LGFAGSHARNAGFSGRDPCATTPPGLMHHADRGDQYAGLTYRRMLARAAMPQSMSRADDCYATHSWSRVSGPSRRSWK
jgi:transposase InsO family protein